MKIYAVNGSPRKKGNTALLLQSALDGASAQSSKSTESIETTMIHLYDLNFKSCLSCFSCKRLGGKSYGRCAINDTLTPVLQELSEADGIIFGSPIYYGNITGLMKSFLERFMFPFSAYDANYSSLAPKQMPTAFVYTMNIPESMVEQCAYKQNLQPIESALGRIFTPLQTLFAYNTYQFDDYSKYKMEIFSESDKAAHREHQFPLDCQEAARIGQSMRQR